ncbi:MAG: hypothetical protein AB1425_01820 [Actinomycetota bacterium]
MDGSERAELEAYYRRVLKTSVEFEKRIRERWRKRCREKSRRIAELEARVAELERRLRAVEGREEGVDRKTKERKLIALMIGDLGVSDTDEPEMNRMTREVQDLPDEELDRALARRLGLTYPADEEDLMRALERVQEPERLSEGFTGAPDMSHEARPGEREG